jgi:hypothetical protein
MAEKFPSLSMANRMLVAGIMANHLPDVIQAAKSSATGHNHAAATEASIEKVLLDVLSDSDAADIQAWLLRIAPLKGLPKNISQAMEALVHSPFKRVRAFAYLRIYDSAGHGATGEMAENALATAAKSESSRLLKQLAFSLARQAAVIAKSGK